MISKNMAWRIFLLFACAYFISNLFRGMNVGFAPYLTQQLGLSGGDLGLLTSFYFIGFALAQLPAGLLLDRWGARRTNAGLLLIAALGGLIFACSGHLYGLFVGRFLIGVGIAVGLAGAFMILAQTFPKERLPMLTGLTVAIGGMGGVMVGTPLNYALGVYDWQTITVMVAGLTVLVSALIMFTLPETHHNHSKHFSFKEQCRGTLKIVKHRVFWRLVSLPSMTGGVFYAAQSLWVRPYMIDVLGYSAEEVGRYVSLLGLAMVAGTASTGILARRLEAWGINLHHFSAIGFLSFMLVQLCLILQVPIAPSLLWLAFGFAGSSWTLAFAYSAEIFPAHILGRVTTSFNMVFFASIFSTQIVIGYILDFWPKINALSYPSVAHLVAWSVFLLLQALAAAVYLWPKPLRLAPHDFPPPVA